MSTAAPRPDPRHRRLPAPSPWREVLPVLLAKLLAAAALGWLLFATR